VIGVGGAVTDGPSVVPGAVLEVGAVVGCAPFEPLELHAATATATATLEISSRALTPTPGSPSAEHCDIPRLLSEVVAEPYDDIAQWLRDAQHVVVLTGAGISTDSGIPDFRGPNGVWTKNPAAEKAAHIDTYVSDAEVRARSWQNRLGSEIWRAEPNAGHRALAQLEQGCALDALLTQNVDGLHRAAGSSPDRIIELHGNVREAKCLQCGWRGPMEETLDRVRAGETDPSCRGCGGILKSATISFGEPLVVADLERAQLAAERSDLFLAIGTSLGVYPAAALPEIALRNGARLVVMNAEPTPFDGVAAAVVRTPLGEALPALMVALASLAAAQAAAPLGNNRPGR
jgi:NAD-dependent deacetylase